MVIWEGQVRLQLNSGIDQEEFAPRLLAAVKHDIPSDDSRSQHSPAAQESTPRSIPAAPSSSAPLSTQQSAPDRQAQIQSLLAERKQRLDAEKKDRSEAEKRDQALRAEQRASATNADGSLTAQRKHAEEEKKRKAEAQAEKERVRRLVEADRAERRMRSEHQRLAWQREQEQEAEGVIAQQAAADEVNRKGVLLQVRLLDGASIRGTFLPEDTPSRAVRRWIDENRTDSSMPYRIKIVLTPQPSKAISETDEDRPLRELGLAPSAALVLVPVKGVVATAYPGPRGGAFGHIFSFFLALVFHILHFFSQFLQSIIGSGIRAAGDNVRRHEGPDATPGADALAPVRAEKRRSPQPTGPGSNVRTLRDQERRDQDDRQLYNGNQLNFEPNKKDDEDKR